MSELMAMGRNCVRYHRAGKRDEHTLPNCPIRVRGWNEDSYGKTPTVTRNIYEEKGTAKQPKK